uniref:Uncharacterized protein n=1 Tax=viral metagenome TaxID=1070528 RepID=A0A6H2A6S6_9ZZZZ
MDNLKLIIGYMTLKELKRVEAIIKRMIKTKEDQHKLIKKLLL